MPERLQISLNKLAADASQAYDSDNALFRTTTTPVKSKAPEALTAIHVATTSKVGGVSGEYTIVLGGELDGQGKYVDPKKVNFFEISMDVIEDASQDNVHPGGFYFVRFEKTNDSNDWQVSRGAMSEDNKYSQLHFYYGVEPVAKAGEDPRRAEPLNDATLFLITGEAQLALGRALAAEPIQQLRTN